MVFSFSVNPIHLLMHQIFKFQSSEKINKFAYIQKLVEDCNELLPFEVLCLNNVIQYQSFQNAKLVLSEVENQILFH